MGSQAFDQHSGTADHRNLSKAKFSHSQAHIDLKQTTPKAKAPGPIILDPSLNENVSSAEAMWVCKFAEDDFSLWS